MKQLRLALNQIKRYLPQSLLLIVELVLTLMLITRLINTYNWEMREYNAFQHEDFANALYFSGKIDQELNSEEREALLQYLENQAEFVAVSDIDQFSVTVQNPDGTEHYCEIYAADPYTCKVLGMEESALFDKEKIANEILPAVIIADKNYNHLTQGKQYHGKIDGVYQFETEPIPLDFDAAIEINEIRRDKMQIYPRYNSKTNAALNYQYIIDYPKLGMGMIFVPKVEELFGGYEDAPFWILLSPDTAPERRADILKEVQKYGHVCPKEDADKETLEGVRYRLKRNAVRSAMLLALSILGLFSLSFLNVKQLSKRFSIYYLCGCSRKKSMGLYAVYMYLVGVIAILIYYAVTSVQFYFPWNYEMELSFYQYQSFNMAGGLSILICFSLITLFSLVPFVLNYRKSSIEMYRL